MIFRNKKKPEDTAPTYVSNIGVQQLGFMEQLDRTVAVISEGESIAINRAVHVCITQEALEQTVQELRKESGKEYKYMEMPLGMALDNVIQQELYDALILYGFPRVIFTITREDLQVIRDLVDSYCIMNAEVRNRLEHKKAYELMKDKIVYILGTLPNPELKKEDTFGYEIVKRKTEAGEEYDSVKCFLTPGSAQKYNGAKRPITPVTVKSITWFTGSCIIEPHRNYWVEFRHME